jgi:trigger factor
LRVFSLFVRTKFNLMDITLDRQKSNEALIKIKLKEDDYQPQVSQKIKEYSKKAQLKGFRPGKVPFGLIKKMYGKSIMVEEINHMLSSSLSNYIKEQDLKILGDPLPNLEKSQTIDWDHQKDFEFEYNIGLVDDFEYDLEKRKVTEFSIKLDPKAVEEEMETIRKNYGERVEVEVSEQDDIVHGSLVESSLDIENDVAIPIAQIEKKEQKKFIGKKAGETITFNISKAIADEAYRGRLLGKSSEDLEGKEVSEVELKVSEIKRLEPAVLNQEFYDKLFGEGEVKSEEEFKEKIASYLENSFKQDTENYLDHSIREELVKATKMELPEEFLKRWLLATNEGKANKDDIDQEFQGYADEMKWNLILNRVAEDHEVQVENEEVVERAKQMIAAQFAQSGLGEQMNEQLGAFADNYLKGNEGQNYLQVFNQVRNQKILKLIKEKIKIVKKEVNLEQFKKEINK